MVHFPLANPLNIHAENDVAGGFLPDKGEGVFFSPYVRTAAGDAVLLFVGQNSHDPGSFNSPTGPLFSRDAQLAGRFRAIEPRNSTERGRFPNWNTIGGRRNHKCGSGENQTNHGIGSFGVDGLVNS